ncbi:hypothetical protein IG195_02645 [Arthrobacter sp. TES]|uniref:endonuclease domain-containing protein n=1 Tax=Paenarthrobacter TaxID=1742992 RepID=UPI0004CF3AF5|nr:hypothetical protein [Paenarthrobacter ureafaciens]ERI35910.2 hypothetical protein M707_19205 [Arthrobacter sp. AK-YN10]KUR65361.1 hypothetical protein JM67_05860 [Arthrobacter sp. ATCC 21022]QOI64028.1 hypothetical protein IG195_02645 [Arthrobacter sp. TES]RWW95917.1 hypothetical protein AUR_15795 [Paenarthrobacter ureafaciens]
MKTPSALPDPLSSTPFTWQEAARAGVSRRRLSHHSLASPSRAVRVPGSGADHSLADMARPLTQVTAFSAASHATAFLLWEFPGFLPGSNEPVIHISRPEPMAIPRRRGVVGHRGQFFDDEITIGADSAPETRLRLALGRAGLPTAEANVRTELSPGVERQPDLSFREWRVAVDYEGEGHSEPEQIVRDIEKQEDFARAGWILVRISKRHMTTDATTAVRKVRRALEQHGWSPI